METERKNVSFVGEYIVFHPGSSWSDTLLASILNRVNDNVDDAHRLQ